jgi:hypothetical protein
MNVLVLAALAGSPPPLKEVPDAELADMLEKHLKITSDLQANMRKHVKRLLRLASRS